MFSTVGLEYVSQKFIKIYHVTIRKYVYITAILKQVTQLQKYSTYWVVVTMSSCEIKSFSSLSELAHMRTVFETFGYASIMLCMQGTTNWIMQGDGGLCDLKK